MYIVECIILEYYIECSGICKYLKKTTGTDCGIFIYTKIVCMYNKLLLFPPAIKNKKKKNDHNR